jgi:ABC-type antimicrobial peptide transport system permease subunit
VALGATPGGVLRHLLLRGLGPVVPGLVLGAGLAYLVLRSLAASFYGVSAWDPSIYVGVGATLVGAVFLSAWLPARRALSPDPARVLQGE